MRYWLISSFLIVMFTMITPAVAQLQTVQCGDIIQDEFSENSL